MGIPYTFEKVGEEKAKKKTTTPTTLTVRKSFVKFHLVSIMFSLFLLIFFSSLIFSIGLCLQWDWSKVFNVAQKRR